MTSTSRRATTVAALALAITLPLTACGNSGSTADTTSGSGSDSTTTVAFVPKIQGIPFFEAMNSGGKQAADEFGFEWAYSGATTADPSAQADVARSLIQQNVDALAVAPNDPNSMAPVLQEAADAGITAFTADTDAPDSTRKFFVSQASSEGIGTALLDQLAQATGDSGKFAIVSCGRTAANLNSWIDVIKQKLADHPNMTLVDTVYADEDQAKAVTMAKDLMNAHPDLAGLIGPCTTAAPGIAQAVDEAGKVGTISTVGVGTPQAMLPFLKSGASSASVLWNVEDHGYLTAWAGWQAATGQEFPTDGKPFDVGRVSGVTWDEGTRTLLLGEPLILTADNAGDFDY